VSAFGATKGKRVDRRRTDQRSGGILVVDLSSLLIAFQTISLGDSSSAACGQRFFHPRA
jgi:hypothetical protein